MEQITLQVRDKNKARALLDFLKTLDFVETVAGDDLPAVDSAPETRQADFFALAGLWAGRDISLEAIRQKAWPERA